MNINGKTIVITGTNRRIGTALVDEALTRGAKKVYASSDRDVAPADDRVTPLTLDVTDEVQIQSAVARINSLDLLINNAGVGLCDEVHDRTMIDWHLHANLFATHSVTHALLPRLIDSRGAVVNVLSLAALAALPIAPAYSISKAAEFSLTQSLRALLAKRGLRVHAVFARPVDSDMAWDPDMPKSPPESIARAVYDGIENGDEDIFPYPTSELTPVAERIHARKIIERESATYVGAPSALR
jgi:NAD(P)-dependent dehydrogenase (short-subunit alcohol dehydrogenase family)